MANLPFRSFNDDGFYPFSKTGEVSELGMPVMYMIGEEREPEIEAALTYKSLNPRIHLSVIPFAGHLVHREQPDLYSETLARFFQRSHEAQMVTLV